MSGVVKASYQGDKISSSSKEIIWAKNLVTQYNYRVKFGLSYKEFMEEPIDIYVLNNKISILYGDIEKHELKKSQRRRTMR